MPFSDLPTRLTEVRERIERAQERGGHGQQVTIIAVTKTHGADAVSAVARAGLKDVGENRVQEAVAKMEQVPETVRWHLIGHLQRNKVANVDGFSLIHSIDSSRLADSLDTHGVQTGRRIEGLLQVNLSGEATKGGFNEDASIRESERLVASTGLGIRGVMTMAPFDAGENELRKVFAGARGLRNRLVEQGHRAEHLSMGMSGDYEVAVEEGATLVRLGTVLFGSRA